MILTLAACGRPIAKTSDEDIELLRQMQPGITDACAEKLRLEGMDAFPARVDECFQMATAKRWAGLWRKEFEGSQFCPSPAQNCHYDSPGDKIWLSFADRQVGSGREMESGALYAVDFIGRRTLKRGGYGHFGVFDHEIVVDRIISIEPVTPTT